MQKIVVASSWFATGAVLWIRSIAGKAGAVTDEAGSLGIVGIETVIAGCVALSLIEVRAGCA